MREYVSPEPTTSSPTEETPVGATWATATEDDPLTGLDKLTTKRVRIEISNEGTASSSSVLYRLEISIRTRFVVTLSWSMMATGTELMKSGVMSMDGMRTQIFIFHWGRKEDLNSLPVEPLLMPIGTTLQVSPQRRLHYSRVSPYLQVQENWMFTSNVPRHPATDGLMGMTSSCASMSAPSPRPLAPPRRLLSAPPGRRRQKMTH